MVQIVRKVDSSCSRSPPHAPSVSPPLQSSVWESPEDVLGASELLADIGLRSESDIATFDAPGHSSRTAAQNLLANIHQHNAVVDLHNPALLRLYSRVIEAIRARSKPPEAAPVESPSRARDDSSTTSATAAALWKALADLYGIRPPAELRHSDAKLVVSRIC